MTVTDVWRPGSSSTATPGTAEQLNAASLWKASNAAGLKAIDTTGFGVYANERDMYFFLRNTSNYFFDLNNTSLSDGHYSVAPTTGPGRFTQAGAHVDAVLSMLSGDLVEILPPVTASLNFGSISSGGTATLTVTVQGATAGDFVQLQQPSNLNNRLYFKGDVTANNTVTITLANESGGAIDPAEGTWAVLVKKPNLLPAVTVNGLRIFSNLLAGSYTSGTLETDLGIAANEAAFRLLLNSTWRRKMLLVDTAIKTIIQGSTTANAAMEDIEGAGY